MLGDNIISFNDFNGIEQDSKNRYSVELMGDSDLRCEGKLELIGKDILINISGAYYIDDPTEEEKEICKGFSKRWIRE